MKKFFALILIIIVACAIGGFYGMLHDQLTYTISPEYYTKFKFYQFRLASDGQEAVFSSPRLQVAIVGFMATWWMGIPIGLILGLVGLIHTDWKKMFTITIRAFFIAVIVAFFTGIIGLYYAELFIKERPTGWYLPDNVTDIKSFIKVGSMHNFSYLGGLTGLIAGIIYSIKQKGKYR